MASQQNSSQGAEIPDHWKTAVENPPASQSADEDPSVRCYFNFRPPSNLSLPTTPPAANGSGQGGVGPPRSTVDYMPDRNSPPLSPTHALFQAKSSAISSGTAAADAGFPGQLPMPKQLTPPYQCNLDRNMEKPDDPYLAPYHSKSSSFSTNNSGVSTNEHRRASRHSNDYADSILNGFERVSLFENPTMPNNNFSNVHSVRSFSENEGSDQAKNDQDNRGPFSGAPRGRDTRKPSTFLQMHTNDGEFPVLLRQPNSNNGGAFAASMEQNRTHPAIARPYSSATSRYHPLVREDSLQSEPYGGLPADARLPNNLMVREASSRTSPYSAQAEQYRTYAIGQNNTDAIGHNVRGVAAPRNYSMAAASSMGISPAPGSRGGPHLMSNRLASHPGAYPAATMQQSPHFERRGDGPYHGGSTPSHPVGSGHRGARRDDSDLISAPLKSHVGRIYELCKDQHGCRYLQKQLDECDPENTQIIFAETIDHISELMTDSFGNYLCQKLFEHSDNSQRMSLLQRISPDLVKISLNTHGTRAVQKIVENLSTPAMVSVFQNATCQHVVTLIKDLNGNHVIQKCLNHLVGNDIQFIIDACAYQCMTVGTHRHGCCVIQRCLDHSNPAQKQLLIGQVIENAFALVQNAYGNYVVQYILDLEEEEINEQVCRKFKGNICNLSLQKFSSNVVEKCIRVSRPETKRELIEELLIVERLDRIIRDSFGNYVIQTSLEQAPDDQKERLCELVMPIVSSIRNNPHGRRVASRVVNTSNKLMDQRRRGSFNHGVGSDGNARSSNAQYFRDAGSSGSYDLYMNRAPKSIGPREQTNSPYYQSSDFLEYLPSDVVSSGPQAYSHAASRDTHW